MFVITIQSAFCIPISLPCPIGVSPEMCVSSLGGIFSAGFYISALFFALDVVMPRRIDIPAADLTAMQKLLPSLFNRKSRSLLWAQIAFGIGTLFMLFLIFLLLMR